MTDRRPSRPNPHLHKCHVREIADLMAPIAATLTPAEAKDVLLQKALGPTGWYHYLKGRALNHLLHAGRDRELLEDITAARDALDTLIRALDPMETVQ